MLLPSTEKLQVLLSGAVATSQLPIVVGWADSAANASTLAPAGSTSVTNSTTAVDIVPAPASTFLRQLKYLSVYNADTAAATLTVRIDAAGTPRILCVVTLAIGSRLEYTAEGFRAFDNTGALVGAGGGGSAAWGSITGTLSSQTDLVAALAAASPVGLHSVPIMAGAIQPSVTGGCSAVTSIASAANQPDIVTIDFDPTTQEYAQFAIPMPKSWNEGTVTAAFRWSHPATTTNFGVVWSIQAVGVSNDDTIAVNFGTAQQIVDTGGTTNDLYITSQTPAMTVGGSPAAEDTVFFRVSRVTGDGSDTMAVDARLHSVVLYMTTDASTDA